ncbi:MAG: glycosyltransferase family 8 protein [Clostridium sp.]
MIDVVYACNDAYVRQTLVSMVSLTEHNQDANIYLMYDGLSIENRRMMLQILERYHQTITFLDMKEWVPEWKLDEEDRHPRTIYAKLFMEQAIPSDRVLYLDSDVIVTDSLEPLFGRNMEHECVAGVLMPYSSKLKQRIHGFPGEPYICDGVVLFNMKLWKSTEKTKQCLEYIRKQQGKPPMLSEGTLNHVCRGEIGVLEPKYNQMPSMLMYPLEQLRQLFRVDFYYQDETIMEQAVKKPILIHFMNELYNRPWFAPCDHPWRNLFRKRYEELFGEQVYEVQDISLHTKVTRLLYRFLPFEVYKILYQLKQMLKR